MKVTDLSEVNWHPIFWDNYISEKKKSKADGRCEGGNCVDVNTQSCFLSSFAYKILLE